MTMNEWAKQEIEFACKQEREICDNSDDGLGADYGVSCYESALKAYNCLADDGHSGFSINLTKQILNRLIEGKPLTPIEDIPEVWNDISCTMSRNTGRVAQYQCKRVSSLFKDAYTDGKDIWYEYHDNNRAVYVDMEKKCAWTNKFTTEIIHSKYPITFPYMPEDTPYTLYGLDFALSGEIGCYDTLYHSHILTPSGEKVDMNRWYKEDGSYGWIEITKEEYDERKVISEQNAIKLAEKNKNIIIDEMLDETRDSI